MPALDARRQPRQKSGFATMPGTNVPAERFTIAGRAIGAGEKSFLVAEVAQSHDGSLGLAHSFVDAVAEAGADAIKFQTHIAAAESTPAEPFRVKFSYADATRYDYWKRMEFTAEQWRGLKEHAEERGLVFLSSPFSLAAVELLEGIGIGAWKVASGEVNNPLLIDAMTATRKPLLLSTGASGWDEIGATARRIEAAGVPFAVFQCTTRYPTPFDAIGLNVLDELRRRFGVPVGLSDHSGTIFPALAAMARGAAAIEVHVAFDRRMFGPDVKSSLTLDEIQLLAEARDAFHTMDAHPVDKDAALASLGPVRALFNKSVALVAPQPKGTVLSVAMLTTKKPADGIPAAQFAECVGRRLAADVPADRVLAWSDLEAER
ncbi:MAG: N-acetylneuraminate synthase family protein [Alphaproteobacteria bacterium]